MAEPIAEVTEAIRRARDGFALCAYLTAGYPDPAEFAHLCTEVSKVVDVVEIGVPFTDPMADGPTIQAASRRALQRGVSLRWTLDALTVSPPAVPWLLMGYTNPFLAFGQERLADALAEAGGAGLIVADLPLEESAGLTTTLGRRGLGLVRLVAPTTSAARLERIASASHGFLYAVTATGVTGGSTRLDSATLTYLGRVGSISTLPVLAGFGVRDRGQVEALAGHVAGVVVGSALIEVIDGGGDPSAFLEGLRPAGESA